jgi:hypothetical protein
MWRRVRLVKTDVSEERVASIFKVEEIYANEEKLQAVANREFVSNRLTFLLPLVYFFYPEDGGDTFLRNATFQKTAFFILTAMITSNSTTSIAVLSRYSDCLLPPGKV